VTFSSSETSGCRRWKAFSASSMFRLPM